MYGLPKIQKSDIPLRPTFSMCHSVQHSLLKWVIQVLNPALAFYSGFCVDDSVTFSSMINQLLHCVEPQFMVPFDIASLFTNVRLDEVIFIYADFIYQSPLISIPSFPKSVFVELWNRLPSQFALVLMTPWTVKETEFRWFSIMSFSCKYFCWVQWKTTPWQVPLVLYLFTLLWWYFVLFQFTLWSFAILPVVEWCTTFSNLYPEWREG